MPNQHTYISQKVNSILNSTYGSTIRTAIADALLFIDNLTVNNGAGNSFVVCTQEDYDSLTEDDKTAAAYFIVVD